MWKGDCFVFDNRVSVKHGLKPGNLKYVQVAENQFLDQKLNQKNMKKV